MFQNEVKVVYLSLFALEIGTCKIGAIRYLRKLAFVNVIELQDEGVVCPVIIVEKISTL